MANYTVSIESASVQKLLSRLSSREFFQFLNEQSNEESFLLYASQLLQQYNNDNSSSNRMGLRTRSESTGRKAENNELRASLMNQLLAKYPAGLSISQMAQLDLQYVKRKQDALRWQTIKLVRDEDDAEKHMVWQEETIKFGINKMLSIYFDHYCHVERIDNNLWIQISIYDDMLQNDISNLNFIYFIFVSHSEEYLLYSKIEERYSTIILEVLRQVLRCDRLSEHELNDINYKSLIELLTKRNTLGSFSKYRLEQLDENPLNHLSNWSDANSRKIYLENNIVPNYSLNQYYKSKDTGTVGLKTIANIQLGKDPLPTLTQVNYVVDCDLRALYPDISVTSSRMHVEFEGRNVLEGFRQLVQSGIGQPPLPEHMARLPSMASNVIYCNLAKPDLSSNTILNILEDDLPA
ncbi:centromere protein Chl4/mis15/CENP-N [Syncephalis fuscata]|nr:centromere protein Chl4/mis15/CENP-N [Syncephalis fuscata]